MSHDPIDPEERLDEAQERARRAVRELPDPVPDEAFRRDVRARFLDGEIPPMGAGGAGGAQAVSPAGSGDDLPPPPSPAGHDAPEAFLDDDLPPPPPAAADDAPAGEPPAPATPRALALRRWPWAAILIATFTLLWVGAPSDPGWRLVDVEGTGTVRIGRSAFTTASRGDIERRLASGARVQVPPTATLEIASAGNVLMQLAPGTEVVLPTPRRMALRPVWEGEIRSGVLRLSTGPDFAGSELVLKTPGGDVHVTGTTLAVRCGESDTCVCVLEGLVVLGSDAAGHIEPGMRRTRFFPTGAVLDEPIPPEEAAILDALRIRAARLVADEVEGL